MYHIVIGNVPVSGLMMQSKKKRKKMMQPKKKEMSFHNRPAKADMGSLIVLGIVCESEWQVGVQLNPTVTSGEL